MRPPPLPPLYLPPLHLSQQRDSTTPHSLTPWEKIHHLKIWESLGIIAVSSCCVLIQPFKKFIPFSETEN